MRKAKKMGGFNLLELAAAILIFSVGILTVVVIFHKGILQAGLLYEEEIALETAESIIERLRAKGLFEVEGKAEIALPASPTVPAGRRVGGPESLEAAKFLNNLDISLFVRDFDPQSRGLPAGRQGLKEITLRLSWQNFGHRKRQITLTTLMADLRAER